MSADDRIQISYEECVSYVMQKLKKNAVAVLATCGKDMLVSARSMSIVHDGLVVWFQTDVRSLKVKQMQENANVALTFDNVQYEGEACDMGTWSDEGNDWFCKAFEQRHKGSYDSYTRTREEVIYRVTPHTIRLWRYHEGAVYRDFIDTVQNRALREIYTVTKME